MSKESMALEWLSEHLGQPITLDYIGYESYIFEGEELAASLIPNECSSYFKPDQSVLTYLYAYGDTMVYFFHPLALEVSDVIRVGLLDNFQRIDYKILKGDI